MSEPRDPARLLEAPDAELAELEPLLREARTQGPSAEQRARMRAALGLPAAADPAAADHPAPAEAPARAGKTRAPHAAPTPTWFKLSLLVALGIGAAFLALRALRSAQPDAVANALPHAGVERSGQPAGGVGARPSATAPDSQLPPRVASEPPAAAAPMVEPARPATPARRGRTAMPARAAEEPSAPSRDVTDPAGELALLKRAKAHARSAPERALALLAEHEQRFANGAFVQEREVIAIEALLVRGDRDAAEQRAARFFERFADSAHARRVRALLSTSAAVLSDTKSSAPPHPSR